METIGEYLTRVMRQKNLDPVDVARLCGLTDSYIGRLRKMASANLTVDTIKKLAMALDVNPHELFTVASGVPAGEAAPVSATQLLDLFGKVVGEPTGVEVLQQVFAIPAGQREAVMDYLRHIQSSEADSEDKPSEE